MNAHLQAATGTALGSYTSLLARRPCTFPQLGSLNRCAWPPHSHTITRASFEHVAASLIQTLLVSRLHHLSAKNRERRICLYDLRISLIVPAAAHSCSCRACASVTRSSGLVRHCISGLASCPAPTFLPSRLLAPASSARASTKTSRSRRSSRGSAEADLLLHSERPGAVALLVERGHA